jgi:hypothetical protein
MSSNIPLEVLISTHFVFPLHFLIMFCSLGLQKQKREEVGSRKEVRSTPLALAHRIKNTYLVEKLFPTALRLLLGLVISKYSNLGK